MTESVELKRFREMFETRDSIAAEWKAKSGSKVVGCISTYVPEEIIYAAELLPVEIFGKYETFAKSDVYLPGFSCSFMRGLLEKLLEKEYEYLDLITLPSLCDSIWGFYSIWRELSPDARIYLLHYPSQRSRQALDYFVDTVERFKSFIEASSTKDIFDDDLRAAIQVYEQNRRLLKRLYELRKRESPPVSGVEALQIVLSSMTTPKQVHNQLLEKLLDEIENRQEHPKGDIRLLISGHIIEDPAILRLIEDSGALIVSDDLDTGSRYFWASIESASKPVEAISKRYFELPSPYGSSFEDRIRYLKAMVKEFRVDGIVFPTRKFCDPYLFDYAVLGRAMKEESVPSMLLEYEYPLTKASLKTRVEAFVEMLR
jgi:benzoyl-CoA reductase subunit C